MNSLADILGVPDLITGAAPQHPVPEPTSAKELCRLVLLSQDYRESLLRRIKLGELPPAVELWYLNTAFGKPVERVEVEDTTGKYEHATPEAIEARATLLLDAARKLRAELTPTENTPPGETSEGSVH